MNIRDAVPGDLESIVRIYNHHIETGVATFDLEPHSVEDRRPWFEKFGEEHPMLVAVDEAEAVLGFAYYSPYREKAGWNSTKETTIYLAPEHCGRGTGSALYEELIRRARAAGVHLLVAVLGGENAASEALHRKFGFEFCGLYPEAGFKFGRRVHAKSFIKLLD